MSNSVVGSLIFFHRWLGVALCGLFLIWFPSGIGMMYFGWPAVTAADRLQRLPTLDPASVVITPGEAAEKLRTDPTHLRLTSFDGRPVYRFGGARAGSGPVLYADSGDAQGEVPMAMVHRIAAAWTGQPVSRATDDGGEGGRSVDAADAVERAPSPFQVLMGKRRAGLRLAGDRRGRPVHDDGVPPWRVSWTDSSLVLFHTSAKARSPVETQRDLVVGHRHHHRHAGHHHRCVDVLAGAALPLCRRPDQHSLPWSETSAHGIGTDLWRDHGYVCVQRHAVDGPVPLAERPTPGVGR